MYSNIEGVFKMEASPVLCQFYFVQWYRDVIYVRRSPIFADNIKMPLTFSLQDFIVDQYGM